MNRNKLRKRLCMLLLVAGGLCLLLYELKPPGISQYTNKANSVLTRDPNVIVPVLVANTRYNIPAPYLRRVGYWYPDKKVYGSPLTMEVKGTNFSPPSQHADPGGPEKILSVWIASTQQVRAPTAKPSTSDNNKRRAKTVKEFDANVSKGLYPEHLIRAPELDKFRWTVYRGMFGTETYVGQRVSGGLLIFDCLPDEPGLMALCFDYHEEDGVHIEYNFPKRYVADAENFNIGLTKLLDGFKNK